MEAAPLARALPLIGRRRRNLRSKPRGVMIVDAIIAIFFLTLAFGAIISTMVMGIQAGRRGREYQVAGLVARQVVENVRSFRSAGLPIGTYSDARALGPIPQLANLMNSSASASVTAYDFRSRQVVITITWYSIPTKRTITHKFTTLFASDGVAK